MATARHSLPGPAAPAHAPRRLPRGLAAGVAVWAVLCGILALAVVAKVRFGIPWHHTLGDPATTTGWPFYLGFVSNVGALLWTSTSAIFLFRSHLERAAGGAPAWGRFLLASGLFTALLGLDDLFLVHDQVLPDYLAIPQAAVLGGYGALGLAYLAAFRREILRGPWPLLMLAFGLLGASVLLDLMQDRLGFYLPASGFLEDAAKVMGIGTWLAYAVSTCAAPPGRRDMPA